QIAAFEAGDDRMELSDVYAIAEHLNFDPRDFIISVGEYFFAKPKPSNDSGPSEDDAYALSETGSAARSRSA
ncbi:MAG: hypothetical protein AAGJ87_09980, partial [Pseudomonadota bacterium]